MDPQTLPSEVSTNLHDDDSAVGGDLDAAHAVKVEAKEEKSAAIPPYDTKVIKLMFTTAELEVYNHWHAMIMDMLFSDSPKHPQDVTMDAGLARLLTLLTSGLRLFRLRSWLEGPSTLAKTDDKQFGDRFLHKSIQRELCLHWFATRSLTSNEVVPNRDEQPQFFTFVAWGNPKLRYLCKIVQDVCLTMEAPNRQSHKQLLVFAEYPDTQKFLVMFLTELLFRVAGFHSGLSLNEREQLTAEFNSGNKIDIMVCDYSTAGVSANLQEACSVVVLYEAGNSASAEMLALGRVRGLGQRYPQVIYRLCVADTVDDWMEDNVLKQQHQDGVGSYGGARMAALAEHIYKLRQMDPTVRDVLHKHKKAA